MSQGKADSLALLKRFGFNVPDFIVITHEQFISWGESDLYQNLLLCLEKNNKNKILEASSAFVSSVMVPFLNLETNKQYAVRSSANLEDSPEHSFAGIFETLLFQEDLSSGIKKVWSSLFSQKSLSYCSDKNISWKDLKMNLIIQEMVPAEKSGVLFQTHPDGNINGQVIIAGIGLGQGVVDEQSDTDCYLIEGEEIKESFIDKKQFYLGLKDNTIQRLEVPLKLKSVSVLDHDEIDKLLGASTRICTHFQDYMDIEFSFFKNKLYLLQARPITTIATRKKHLKEYTSLKLSHQISDNDLFKGTAHSKDFSFVGIPCSEGEVEADCEVVLDFHSATNLSGKILVAKRTDPAWGYFFSGVKGIIIEKGSMLSHAIIISRELGIPCIINVEHATTHLKSGMRIRMNGDSGIVQVVGPVNSTTAKRKD